MQHYPPNRQIVVEVLKIDGIMMVRRPHRTVARPNRHRLDQEVGSNSTVEMEYTPSPTMTLHALPQPSLLEYSFLRSAHVSPIHRHSHARIRVSRRSAEARERHEKESWLRGMVVPFSWL
jgi:hypothetical protein